MSHWCSKTWWDSLSAKEKKSPGQVRVEKILFIAKGEQQAMMLLNDKSLVQASIWSNHRFYDKLVEYVDAACQAGKDIWFIPVDKAPWFKVIQSEDSGRNTWYKTAKGYSLEDSGSELSEDDFFG